MNISKLSSFILISLLCSGNAFSSPWNQLGRKLFVVGCTTAGAGIAIGPMTYDGYNKKNKLKSDENKLKNFSDPLHFNYIYSPYIKNVLNKVQVPNAESVKMVPITIYASGKSVLLYDAFHLWPLINLLPLRIQNTLFPKNQLKRKQFEAVIGHEGRHIANNDAVNRKNMQMIIPSTLFASTQLLKYGYRYTSAKSSPQGVRFALQQLAKIPAGAALAAASFIGLQFYKTWCEKRADIESAQMLGPEHARALAHFFRKLYQVEDNEKIRLITKYNQKTADKKFPFSERTQALRYKLMFSNLDNPIIYPILAEHPPHLARARYLEELADKMEQKEKAKH